MPDDKFSRPQFERFNNRAVNPPLFPATLPPLETGQANPNITEDMIRHNRELADALMSQTSAEPIQHWTQGAAMLMNALNSRVYRNRANEGEQALKQQDARALGDFMQMLPPEQQEMFAALPPNMQKELMPAIAAQRFTPSERFETVTGPEGNIVGQRNTLTGRVVDDPRAGTTSPRFDEFDVIGADGSRTTVEGRVGPQGAEVLTPTGQFAPVAQVFPNAARIEPAITRRMQGEPGEFSDPRTRSQRGADFSEARSQMNTSNEIIGLVSDALPRVFELPGTVGIRGKVGLGGAGLLSALGQDELAGAFAEAVSGADQETIAGMQTQLQVLRGRIVPLVTGEQGARLSETEREIASKAVGVIDNIQGPADLTKAYPQVIGAMKQLYAESWANVYTKAAQNPNIEFPFDLTNDADVLAWGEQVSEAGMDLETAKRMLARLRRIQQRGL